MYGHCAPPLGLRRPVEQARGQALLRTQQGAHAGHQEPRAHPGGAPAPRLRPLGCRHCGSGSERPARPQVPEGPSERVLFCKEKPWSQDAWNRVIPRGTQTHALPPAPSPGDRTDV